MCVAAATAVCRRWVDISEDFSLCWLDLGFLHQKAGVLSCGKEDSHLLVVQQKY